MAKCAARSDDQAISPELVVIVPTFKHPVLLAEAIDSALNQSCSFPYIVLICSDGCPFEETDLSASAMAMADPRVLYLRRSNGGPSAARNFAIDFALRTFASMRAVYFLDSDNRLSATALETGYRALMSDEAVSWVYPNIDSFGIDWTANYDIPYSPLLHVIHNNFSDTGSFVRRSVLEDGVRFDEDARSGYEDWDFWLQALVHGHRGKHVAFGFAYRQRPESRFREMSRQRASVLERLRQRHWSIATPKNLIDWEHEQNPRYLWASDEGSLYFAFSDPVAAHRPVASSVFPEEFWAAHSASDAIWLPAFYVFSGTRAMIALRASPLARNVFLLLERAARDNGEALLVLTMTDDSMEIAIEKSVTPPDDAALLMVSAARLKSWVLEGRRLPAFSDLLNPGVVRVAAPIQYPGQDAGRSALQAMGDFTARLRSSDFRAEAQKRWIWRPIGLPQRDEYYLKMCEYLGVSEVMPRLAGESLNIGFIVPIASYGGAEKVTYALARDLRGLKGVKTHLFIVGPAKMKLLSEFRAAFDTVNFLADPEFPIWGGPISSFGQSMYMPDAPELKTPEICGLLAGLDVLVNCQSSPVNSIMGALRRLRTKTVHYLHLTDTTRHGRPAGHTYMSASFEHVYDLVCTCSQKLAGELHYLGIPREKLMPIANAACTSITDEQREHAIALRATPRGERFLRCLYFGRLDHQKGVERLFACLEKVRQLRLPIEFRIVGSTLVDGSGFNWAKQFARLDVEIEPPVYSTDLINELYVWSDVLLLPSRWEGAPLVIPECQQLGTIPLCVRVGAIDELMTHGVDGLLVEDAFDEETAQAMTNALAALIENDEWRLALAVGAVARSAGNRWDVNFRPFRQWLFDKFPDELALNAVAQNSLLA